MKKIIFLVLSFLIGNAGAEEVYSYTPYVLGLDIGRQLFPISPTGSFLPTSLTTYPNYPPYDIAPDAATAIDVSHLPAGTLIRVKRVGAVKFAPSWSDETIYTMIVFANANGDHIPAGQKSNAWTFGPVHFCPTFPGTSIVDFPYDMNISGQGIDNENSYILEVPVGAAKLLVAPADCPSQDNSDPNGDYKLEVSYPIVEKIDIYQVVKNPILFAPSTTIDLVAGKNADIVVKTAPNINVEGSYIEWKSTDGLLTKTFNLKPGQTTSTASGDVTFYIDPVPKEADFINGETQPRVFLRGKNISGIVVDLDTSVIGEIKTKIHKTKPIRLGFVPISGGYGIANGAFVGATKGNAQFLATIGGELVRALYPIADEDYSYTVSEPRSIGLPSLYAVGQGTVISKILAAFNVFADIGSLYKLKFFLDRNLPSEAKISHIIGVATSSYLTFKGPDIGFGVAPFIPNEIAQMSGTTAGGGAAIVQFDAQTTLAHELGHLFAASHNSGLHGDDTTEDVYNSFSLPASWDLTRGPLGTVQTLMAESAGYVGYWDKIMLSKPIRWFSFDDYIKVFKNNLFYTRSNKMRSFSEAIRIEGYFDTQNEFKILNTYLLKNLDVYLNASGLFVAEIKDYKDNTIASFYEKETHLNVDNTRVLSFSVGIPQNAMSIVLFEYVNGVKKKIGQVTLPSDMIKEEIKYAPESVLNNITYDHLRDKISKSISALDKSIQCRSFSEAKQILSTELIPIVKSTLKVKASNASEIDADSFIFNDRILNSLVRVTKALPSNILPNLYVSTCLDIGNGIGSYSNLTVTKNKKMDNPNYVYRIRAWFDNNEIYIKDQQENMVVKSPEQTLGLHQWTVKTYMVDKKQERSILTAIAKYELNLPSTQQKINALKVELDSLYKEVKNPIEITYEVN